MSMMSAPSESMFDIVLSKDAGSEALWMPPSEKESGVMLRMDMIRVERWGSRDLMGGRLLCRNVRGDWGA
jgi:hypothetical protein